MLKYNFCNNKIDNNIQTKTKKRLILPTRRRAHRIVELPFEKNKPNNIFIEFRDRLFGTEASWYGGSILVFYEFYHKYLLGAKIEKKELARKRANLHREVDRLYYKIINDNIVHFINKKL